MSSVTINGISFSGKNISVIGRRVMIDGVEVSENIPMSEPKLEVRIVEGTIESLTCDGNVTAGAVKGSVSSGGNVRCDCVGGSVNAGGNVNCGRVQGPISAGGNVRHA